MPYDEVTTRLAPQMADYDRLSARVEWHPYLMFFQQPNFLSPSVTTDRFGFRPTIESSGQRVTLDDVKGRTVNLIVGNSVAFGVGASTDDKCLVSRLANHTGECWLNFSGRAFGAMQELILFQSYRHKLGGLRRVVLFTGLNDLYLYYAPKVFDETFGIFFFSDAFYRAMNQGSEEPKSSRAPLSRLSRLLLRRGPRVSAPLPDPDYETLIDERRGQRGRIIEHLARTLEIWGALARGLGFRLTYVLQPILPWVGKVLSTEEQELLAAQDSVAGRWHRILRAALDQDHHDWYATSLSKLCTGNGIAFVDLGSRMSGQKQWLFIDRVHINDAGQDLAARLLAAESI